ncbi:MAG: hypothetical protein P8177_05825 [Gemmatimonadota bacterium]
MTTTEWCYRLDASNIITGVGPGWDEFARENGGTGAVADRVVGRHLLDFVAGRPARQLMLRLLEAVRSAGAPVRVPFRCDSPDQRRYMAWNGVAEEGGGVRIVTRLLDEEARSTVDLLRTARARRGAPVTVCSWCKRIRGPDGAWLDAEVAIERLALFMDLRVPALTHGICPTCSERILDEHHRSAAHD